MRGVQVLNQKLSEKIPAKMPEAVRVKVMEKMETLWASAYEKAQGASKEALYALERHMREEGLKVVGTLISAAVQRGAGTGYEGTSRLCEGCGEAARFVGHRTKRVFSLVFPWDLKRAYYHCGSCGEGRFPLDEQLGIAGHLSPALEEALVEVNAHVPFERAQALFWKASGVMYNARDAREVTEAWGERLEAEAQQEMRAVWNQRRRRSPIENPEIPERLYISPDGTTVPTEDGWKEVKVAAVFTTSVPLKKGEEPQRERTRYVAGIESSQAFGRRLYVEALKQGVEKTAQVVVVGDGAHWIWNEAETWLPKNRIEIIDFYHASEKLWEASKLVYGEASPRATKWAEHWSNVLYKRDAETVLGALRRLPAQDPVKAALRPIIGYFETNKQRMRYGYFRRRGYFIGSGVTESSCKHLVGARLKQAGMRWAVRNVQAMVQLRTTLLNERWNYRWN